MKRVLYFLTVLSLVSCGPRSLRVMEWNIWHAGHSEHFPHNGCEGTIGLMKESGADVILVIETYGASDKIADSLGYYHRLLSSNLSIYSRYPIVRTYTFPDSVSTFNFGGVMIDVDGTNIRIFDTWLHYLPDAREVPTDSTEDAILAWEAQGSRSTELAAILSSIKPFIDQADSIPIIMGGDFNNHSHLDWTPEVSHMYNHGGAVVRWPQSAMMLDAGFLDSFRVIHPNPAENIGCSWLEQLSYTLPARQDRIDYIYYMGKRLRPVSSNVYNTPKGETLTFHNKEFFYGSDHGFVLTDFQLE